MVDVGLILNFVFGGIVVLIFFWIMRFLGRWGSHHAQVKEVKKGGPTYRRIEAQLKALRREQRKNRADIELGSTEVERSIKEDDEDENGSVVRKDKEVAKDMEQVEVAASLVEDVTTKLQEDAVALIADIQESTDAILEEVKEKIAQEKVEEVEVAKIKSLYNKIRGLNKFSQMDSITAKHFAQYFEEFDDKLKKQIAYEEQSEDHHLELVKKLKVAIKDAKKIIIKAKDHYRELKKIEGRERKKFNSELKALHKLIVGKIKELKREKRKGKGADANLIAQLQREVQILKNNAVQLKKLDSELEATYKFLDQEIKRIGKITGQIKNTERSQQKYERTLKRREEEIEKRLEELKKIQEKISENINEFKGASKIHGLVLTFSANIRKYFAKYIEMIKEDMAFETKLKEIVGQNYVLEKKLDGVVVLMESVNRSESSVENAMQMIIQMVSIIHTEDVALSLTKISKDLKKELKLLDYEKMVGNTMKALMQEIENKTIYVNRLIGDLITKEKKVIAENEVIENSQSTELNKSMETLVDKKVSIDKNYGQQGQVLMDQLKKNSADAKASYAQFKRAA